MQKQLAMTGARSILEELPPIWFALCQPLDWTLVPADSTAQETAAAPWSLQRADTPTATASSVELQTKIRQDFTVSHSVFLDPTGSLASKIFYQVANHFF